MGFKGLKWGLMGLNGFTWALNGLLNALKGVKMVATRYNLVSEKIENQQLKIKWIKMEQILIQSVHRQIDDFHLLGIDFTLVTSHVIVT